MTSLFHRVLFKVFNMFGFLVLKKKHYDKAEPYEQILTDASFAPWKNDKLFDQTFNKIKANTLVDQYRCYELWSLVRETAHLSGAYLEVGVWKGGTGCIIAQNAKFLGVQDNVYLCDTFSGVVKAGTIDAKYKGGEHSDTTQQTVMDLINKLGLDNIKILTGIFPDETAQLISENQFKLCHIDVDVYKSAKDIFYWVWPKLIPGGCVVFDDYGFDTCNGVTKFVNEEVLGDDKRIIYNLNGHAIVIKLF